MEPSGGSASKTKPLLDGGDEVARESEAPQAEAEPRSERLESSAPEPQPPGRLRKTAFKLFGGRKSICSLPSFFGGKNKSQGKGASAKKGMSKSKTHDCISRSAWEDGRADGGVPGGDLEYHGQGGPVGKTLTSSVSAHAVNDPGKRTDSLRGEPSHTLSSETCDPKLSLDKSALSFPRPKKGLKGLFSSIRRHRKTKNVESEKMETFEMSADVSKDLVPVCGPGDDPHDNKHLDSSAEPNLPALNVKDDFIITPECIKDKALSENGIVLIEGGSEHINEGQVLRDAFRDVEERSRILKTIGGALCSNSDGTCPASRNPDYAENDPPSLHSSDQISFIFGDVASLKSFDSLTGCGDIIADQDDDSVAESTISGERSRVAGKRSSCYVTYQGGGEEMASPNEVDGDYLQGLWEEAGKADVCYTSSQLSDLNEQGESVVPGMASSEMEVARSSTRSHVGVDDSPTPGDVLTPQSDQQESVPNSDEGYYDSTTPGPDEEGDRDSRLGNERLLRDSYSGDALYELFEGDDSLMSPSLVHESSLETQPPTPDPLEFLGVMLPGGDPKSSPDFNHKTGLMETEEDRLTKMQQDLLRCELQAMQKAPKESIVSAKGRYYPEKSHPECVSKLKKHQVGLKEDHLILQLESQKRKNYMQQGQDGPVEVVPGNGGVGQIELDKPPHMKDAESVCVSKTSHPLQEPSPRGEQGKQMASLTGSRGENVFSGKDEAEEKHDQTVCFSQALVDFTKNAKILSGLSDGLEDSSTSFAQNIDALPAMVTFDIVDVEDDGESDHQINMVSDEDTVSPHEAFDESYLQKDAFAECDKMVDFYDQAMFLGNTWGVASLPRHLSLTRVSKPMPIPLSLNRRSRSLDTDSLESELGGVYQGQTNVSPSPILTLRTERDPRRESSPLCRRNGHSAGSETRDGSDRTAASWQREPAGSLARPRADGRGACQVQGLTLSQNERANLTCGLTGPLEAEPGSHTPSRKSRTPISNPEVEDDGARVRAPESPGNLTRPSHLPLQFGDCGSQLPHTSSGASRESLRDRTDCASAEGSEPYFPKNYALAQYSDSSRRHAKIKPVGVTQGMPHFQSDASGATKAAIFQEHREFANKGRKVVDGPLLAECNNHTT